MARDVLTMAKLVELSAIKAADHTGYYDLPDNDRSLWEVISSDAGIIPYGAGGYPYFFYPCEPDGQLFGDSQLCAVCALAYLQADEDAALYVEYTGNHPYEHGARCGDCGEWLYEPAGIIVATFDDAGELATFQAFSEWDAAERYRATLPADADVDGPTWCDQEEVTRKYGEAAAELLLEAVHNYIA